MPPPKRKLKVAMAIDPSNLPQGEWADKAREESPDKFPMLWKHCSRCGAGILIACGYNALQITRRECLGILGNEGWTIAPQLVCRSCTCPLSYSERNSAKALFKCRNWVALKQMHKNCLEIYGPIVDKYFTTMNHMDVCYRVGMANAGE